MRNVLVILLACAAHAYGEEATQSNQPSSPTSVQGSAVSRGDHIVLRSGLSLRGLKVLSETVIDVRVEVVPGEEPLILPARQVVKVIYAPDDGGLAADKESSSAVRDSSAPELLPAHKMSPSFSKELAASVSTRIQIYREHDIVTLLEGVASEHQINIVIGEGVRSLPSAKRGVSLIMSPEQSLEDFLGHYLTETAPWLRVEIQFDEVRVSLRPDAPDVE